MHIHYLCSTRQHLLHKCLKIKKSVIIHTKYCFKKLLYTHALFMQHRAASAAQISQKVRKALLYTENAMSKSCYIHIHFCAAQNGICYTNFSKVRKVLWHIKYIMSKSCYVLIHYLCSTGWHLLHKFFKSNKSVTMHRIYYGGRLSHIISAAQGGICCTNVSNVRQV